MDRKLLNYLPPVIGNLKEIRHLMDAEQGVVEQLWKDTENTIKEAFLELHSGYGASRWEKLLELQPKRTDSLEIRNCHIKEKLNERLPFTIRMLHERIQSMLEGEEYQVICNPDIYWLKVAVSGRTLKEAQVIRAMLEEMIPLNLVFLYARREVIKVSGEMKTESNLNFIHEFYPRYNLPYLMYDGTAPYSRYKYNGYKTDSFVDLYPTKLSVRIPRLFVYDHIPKMGLHDKTKQQIKSKTKFSYLSEGNSKVGIENRLKIRTAHKGNVPTYQVFLTIGKHLTQYNGKYQYNGTRKYDSKIIHEIL